jgi:hypothetical protein
MLTQKEVETALDAGRLQVKVWVGNGKTSDGWWTCRRNGKTQTWKTRPGHFRIPIKYGFRHASSINHFDLEHEQASMRIVVPAEVVS